MSIGKILIVEDQAVISTNIEIMLKHRGYEITDIAVTGNEALNSIIKNFPDLVLMDINLPGGVDGIETTKKINALWDLPVVYLTANSNEKYLERAKETESYGYLTKDISLKDQLPITIEFVLYKHKMQREKQNMEDELVISESKFRNIASSARDAIFFIDNSGAVSFWNDAAVKIIGYTKQEVLGRELYKLLAEEKNQSYYKEGFSDFKFNGKGSFVGRIIEIEVKDKEGKVFPVELSLSTFQLKGRWFASGIMRDVSHRKNTENEMERLIEEIQISRQVIQQHANDLISLNQQLAESEVQLKELNANKDKFFSIIAHDLKGPFQGLLGYSEMLARDIENLSKDEIKEFASDFHTSAQHLFKLLENLLQWSRVQRGVIDHNPYSTNIKELVMLNIDLLSGNANQKGIELKLEMDDNIVIFADVNMINTIVRNLISNAIKFTPSGGTITVKAEHLNEKEALVSVSDTGIGISKEDREKIFQIDVHHTTVGTNNEQGTGLGLILCKELVEKNHGEINVESKVGYGTTFKFTVPLGDPNDLM